MKTILKNALISDWAPTIERIARALVPVVAVVIVAVQWLQFTWHRPWAGMMALMAWRPAQVGAAATDSVEPSAPLLLMPAPPLLLLAAASEPIPAPVAPPARKRGRRATRQPKAPTTSV